MNDHECDRLWEVDALREGRLGPKDAEAAERHVRGCEVCGGARSRSEALDAWLANASSPEPTSLELRRMRVRVLRTAGVDPPAAPTHVRMRGPFAAVTALLIGTGIFFAHRHFTVKTNAVAIAQPQPSAAPPSVIDEIPDFAATVAASDGARWTQTRNGSTEHVELDEGMLSIRVRHRDNREHVVVDLPDGTLEDRGTTFEVEAHGGHTTRVAVSEGAVAFRIRNEPEVVLRAGSSWPPPSRIAHASSAATAPGTASAIPSPEDDGSTNYAAAVALLRHRSYAAAASGFHDYVQAHPREPDAEDASYLEAVALSQVGDASGAIAAAERHLSSYPRSFHRKEASLLIARLARDGGDCVKTRKVLAPWLGDNPDPEAQATLRSCAGP